MRKFYVCTYGTKHCSSRQGATLLLIYNPHLLTHTISGGVCETLAALDGCPNKLPNLEWHGGGAAAGRRGAAGDKAGLLAYRTYHDLALH